MNWSTLGATTVVSSIGVSLISTVYPSSQVVPVVFQLVGEVAMEKVDGRRILLNFLDDIHNIYITL